MDNRPVTKRSALTLDPHTKEPIVAEMADVEKRHYYFGEPVGVLVFRPWYPCIAEKGHFANMATYEFPVRLKFVDDPFDADGFQTGNPQWRGWNQPQWIRAAQQLEEEGVRAIVGGCGLTGNMQSTLAAAVDIPLYSSSVMFVPLIQRGLAAGKRVGILTVSSAHFYAHDNALLKECGVDDSIPIAVAGMNECADADKWLTMTTSDYDFASVQETVVNTALKMVEDYPDLGAIVIECTDMPPYSDAVRAATGLPVFDPVDMVKWVHRMVGS